MLLDRQRSINLFTALVLTIGSATGYVNMFTANTNIRLLTILLTLLSSLLCMKMLKLALRVEPISQIYEEWSDQQILLALFQSPDKEQAKKAIKLDTIRIEDLPLTNYLFTGSDSKGIRQRFTTRMMTRFPNAYVIDPKNELEKMKLLSDIQERQTTKKIDKPLIIFADNYDPTIGSLEKLGVYCFITNNDMNTAIQRKVIDGETAKKLDPSVEVTVGLFDGKSIKQLS